MRNLPRYLKFRGATYKRASGSMTWGELTAEIRALERVLAPGSGSPVWGAYLEDAQRECGVYPIDDDVVREPVCSKEFVDYWMDVVETLPGGSHLDFDSEGNIRAEL